MLLETRKKYRSGVRGLVLAMVLTALAYAVPGELMAIGVDDRTPPTHMVNRTKHNLSIYTTIAAATFTSDNEKQVCIFCHAPHNTLGAGPLWNHYSTDAKTFYLYTSPNFRQIMGFSKATMDVGASSRLCLTCHDGTTAFNALASVGTVAPTFDPFKVSFDAAGWSPSTLPAYLGTNLISMHPINFSYEDAKTGDPAGLKDLATVKAVSKLKFFGPNQDELECATCHDPHIYTGWEMGNWDYNGTINAFGNRKFLRRSNDSSALCLSCHIK